MHSFTIFFLCIKLSFFFISMSLFIPPFHFFLLVHFSQHPAFIFRFFSFRFIACFLQLPLPAKRAFFPSPSSPSLHTLPPSLSFCIPREREMLRLCISGPTMPPLTVRGRPFVPSLEPGCVALPDAPDRLYGKE